MAPPGSASMSSSAALVPTQGMGVSCNKPTRARRWRGAREGAGRTLGITARGAYRLCPIQASKSPPERPAKPGLSREEEKSSRLATGRGESGHPWAPPFGQSDQRPVHGRVVVSQQLSPALGPDPR